MKDNIIKKASWDDMLFEETKIFSMNAFRTTFMYGKFRCDNFEECYLEKCSFANSNFENVCFIKCTIIDTDFTKCKFDNVQFVGCKVENVRFDENVGEQVNFID